MDIVRNVFVGIILGIANVIPGVSGGTMAVIFGIYEKLLECITVNYKVWFKNIKFLLSIGAGMGIGILVFSKLVNFLLNDYPMPTKFFFIGVVLGSIPMIYGFVKEGKKSPFSLGNIISFLLGLGAIIATALLNPAESGAIMTKLTLQNATILFLAAALAAMAMIIPGISGSFLMLVLGAYSTIISAVADLNIPLLIPIAIGVLFGLFFGAKLIKVLLGKFPQQTYSAILGLVVGSIYPLFPEIAFNAQLLISVITLCAGAVITIAMSKK